MGEKCTKARLTFAKNILIIPKTFGQIFCGLMWQKLNFLEGACPVKSGIKPTQDFIKRTSYQQSNMVVVVWCLGLLWSFRTWTTCHNWWKHEFCTLSENPEGECPAVSLWPQAQAHLGYAAGQWSQTHQLVHLWMAQEKQNKVLEWPSQSLDLNPIEMLWHDLKQSIHARKHSNVAELKQFCKEEWAKIPPQRYERLIASYHKRLIAVVAAKGGITSY